MSVCFLKMMQGAPGGSGADADKPNKKDLDRQEEEERVEAHQKMQVAQKAIAKAQKAQAIAQELKDKEDSEKQRLEIKEQLRQDYIQRFGEEPPEEDPLKDLTAKPKKDQVAFWIKKLLNENKASNPEGLKVCVKTLKIYVDNLKNNPMEAKFKTIKVTNKAFQERVAPFEGVMPLLDLLGFEDKGETLQQKTECPDGFLCGVAVKFFDTIERQLSS